MIPGVKRPCLTCGKATLNGSYCTEHEKQPKQRQQANRPDRAGYDAAHARTRRQRGPASRYTCTCGRPAQQWALSTGATPGQPWPYSDNPNDYEPMCIDCHQALDRGDKPGGGSKLHKP